MSTVSVQERPAPSTAQDLRDALAYLREHGRCRGMEVDNDGRVCTIGALNMVIHGRPVPTDEDEADRARMARYDTAWYMLLHAMPATPKYRVDEFSDAIEDDREVFAWFEDAIADAERRERAA